MQQQGMACALNSQQFASAFDVCKGKLAILQAEHVSWLLGYN